MTGKISSPVKTDPNTEHRNWQTIAWDGLQLEIPDQWGILQIERRFLGLGAVGHAGPICEIRWQPDVGSRFKPQRVIRRLQRGHARAVARHIRGWSMPAAFSGSDAAVQLTGFTWQVGTHQGYGVVRYCRTCRTVLLLQLMDMPENQALAMLAPLLAGVQDHASRTRSHWRVFDMACRVPSRFELVRFGFHPGRYVLEFKQRRQQLAFFRWAPADAILSTTPLMALAAQKWPAAGVDWSQPQPSRVVGTFDRSRSLGLRMRQRMRGQAAFQWYCLRHLPFENRLLGLALQAPCPYSSSQLKRLTDDFTIV